MKSQNPAGRHDREVFPIRTAIYELAALIMRYWFAILILLFVIRAWRISIVDNSRARTLRNIASSTGQLGELVVTKTSGQAHQGMRFPILQEGMIGTSGRCDIRIRGAGMRKRHAHFTLQDDGLLLKPINGAPLCFADGTSGKQLLAADGDFLVFGDTEVLCVLFDGQTRQVHDTVAAPPHRESDFFDIEDPFMIEKEDAWQDRKPMQRHSKRR